MPVGVTPPTPVTVTPSVLEPPRVMLGLVGVVATVGV